MGPPESDEELGREPELLQLDVWLLLEIAGDPAGQRPLEPGRLPLRREQAERERIFQVDVRKLRGG
jgi:hypothetical protein